MYRQRSDAGFRESVLSSQAQRQTHMHADDLLSPEDRAGAEKTRGGDDRPSSSPWDGATIKQRWPSHGVEWYMLSRRGKQAARMTQSHVSKQRQVGGANGIGKMLGKRFPSLGWRYYT